MKLKNELERCILLLDKPSGLSSGQAVEKAKKILDVEKAGHSGAIDPLYSGLLCIGFRESLKLMPLLQKLPKEYDIKAYIHRLVKKEKLKAVLKKFRGKIYQKPPRRAAVKRMKRKREIYEIRLLKKKGNSAWLFVRCEAGLYIRKLIDQVGNELGGAHLNQLERKACGPFKLAEACSLKELKKKNQIDSLLSIEEVVKRIDLPKITIKEKLDRFLKGKPIMLKHIKRREDIAVFDQAGRLRAIASKTTRSLKPERILKI